jgi:hypothetical protein
MIRHFLVHPKSSACFGRPAYACWLHILNQLFESGRGSRKGRGFLLAPAQIPACAANAPGSSSGQKFCNVLCGGGFSGLNPMQAMPFRRNGNSHRRSGLGARPIRGAGSGLRVSASIRPCTASRDTLAMLGGRKRRHRRHTLSTAHPDFADHRRARRIDGIVRKSCDP